MCCKYLCARRYCVCVVSAAFVHAMLLYRLRLILKGDDKDFEKIHLQDGELVLMAPAPTYDAGSGRGRKRVELATLSPTAENYSGPVVPGWPPGRSRDIARQQQAQY